MRRQAGFFDVDERLKELSTKGDHLERLNAIVDFEGFRPDLARAVPRSDGSKGGRPPFDHVMMFKILILQASHSLSDERAEYLIKDRLSFMRFLGLGLSDPVPDANTIWTFREALTRATIGGKPAIEVLFCAYGTALTKAGFLAMGGQIIDATIVAAPKQRNTEGEKAEIRAGRIPEAWKDKPAKLPSAAHPPSFARRTLWAAPPRRIVTRAGRSSSRRRSPPMTARRASIWPCPRSVIRTTSRLTGAMG
jgi:transposase